MADEVASVLLRRSRPPRKIAASGRDVDVKVGGSSWTFTAVRLRWPVVGYPVAPVVITSIHEVSTKGQGDAHDITDAVVHAVAESGLDAGIATVFVIGSTAGITTIEFEPGAVHDLNAVYEELAPRRGEYRHHLRWGDDNGSSHVRAAMLGPSLTVPFAKGKLLLGTWQQIAFFEFDTRARKREIVVQVIGE